MATEPIVSVSWRQFLLTTPWKLGVLAAAMATPVVSLARAGGRGAYYRGGVITDVHVSCGAERVAAKWSVSLNPLGNYRTNPSGKRLKDKRR